VSDRTRGEEEREREGEREKEMCEGGLRSEGNIKRH